MPDYYTLFAIINNPFNGERGWINTETLEHLNIATPGMRLVDVGLVCKEEIVMSSGLIWFYLEKLSTISRSKSIGNLT